MHGAASATTQSVKLERFATNADRMLGSIRRVGRRRAVLFHILRGNQAGFATTTPLHLIRLAITVLPVLPRFQIRVQSTAAVDSDLHLLRHRCSIPPLVH